MINQQQALDFGTKIVAMIGGFAVGKGWITSDQVVLFSGLAAAIIPLVYSFLANTQKQQIKTVEAMPGVTKILTNAQATPTLEAMAQSDAHPKVEPAKS